MTDDVWAAWREARPPSTLLHLDTAAVGRSSVATLEAVARHARLEAELGGYVAEEHAAPQLAALRQGVAGLMGTDPDGVAFVESAMAALDAVVRAWPLPTAARVLVAASEWGPNLELLEQRGLVTELVAVDGEGVIDLEALARRLGEGAADVVLVDHVAAHRGLVQPAAEILALAREHGVPVWLDAAQSVGHVAVPPGVDAVVATSRKWLTGPRGGGMLAIAEQHRSHLRVRRPAKHAVDRPLVHLLESDEAHVAGRVGLGVAVREHLELGTPAVAERLAEVGRSVREMTATVVGWEVVGPDAPAGSTTALRPTQGQDVDATDARLLHEHDILTTVCQPWRAPGERVREPRLRVSAHVDLNDEDLARTAAALTGG